MPNSNNKIREPLKINFAANHDQASLQEKIAMDQKKLTKPNVDLEEISSQQEKINSIKYAQQLLNDIQEAANKLSVIYQHTPKEKLKYAESLLATHKPLTANEKNRFKEIEEALSNTCIIKAVGDEVVKFQLGILGYEKDRNKITESEFNYLVLSRLKDNNLLDSYRLRVTGDMILKRTSLEICQALDNDLSSDEDYKVSKNLFMARLEGINYELSLLHSESPRDVTQLRNELISLSTQNFENHSEGKLPTLPEVPDHSLELNSHQPSNEPTININPIEEDQKKSTFVSLMQELIPKKKKNLIYIDTIQPTSLETIMQASLEESSSLPENEIFKLNYQTSSKIKEAALLAVHKLEEQFRQSYSIDGSSTHEEMQRSCEAAFKNHDEKLKKPVPCKLTGEKLINKYYEFGNNYLKEKIKKYKTAIDNLTASRKGEYGEFSKHNSTYSHLNKDERKQTLNRIYDHKKATLNRELEKAEKQKALWLGNKIFTQSVEKNGKIKQEEVLFPEKELDFRNLVLNFNCNSASEGKTINVYQDGVFLVRNKKTENELSSIQISNIRTPHKSCITGLTSSSANFYKEHNTKEINPKQTVGMALGS